MVAEWDIFKRHSSGPTAFDSYKAAGGAWWLCLTTPTHILPPFPSVIDHGPHRVFANSIDLVVDP
jgi:hypothetical protein